jgi:hypothetical protein
MTDPTLTLDHTVTISPDTVFRELGGEGVLLDLESGVYFGLDETGARLWQLLQAHGSLRQVCDAMLQEFEVEPARLQDDVLAFVGDLLRRKLVTLAPSR